MKQITLLLYGSLTLGLAVTLFGTFEPINNFTNINSVVHSCTVLDNPKLTEQGKHYKIEILGWCSTDKGLIVEYRFSSINNEATDQ